MKFIGSRMNSTLGLGALHALYRVDGTWYHQLKKFPGILFDRNGYVLFPTKESYNSNSLLVRKKDLHILDGISKIPGYRAFTTKQRELLKTLSRGSNTKSRNKINNHFKFKPSSAYELIKVVRHGSGSENNTEIKQIHREICKELYHHLVSHYGKENIGCDCPTGNGTFIDMIRKDGKVFHLYEIKSYDDLRRSIREAIGQLLEYAFWNFDIPLGALVIVSHKAPSEIAKKYLSNLKRKFSIPIHYHQYDLVANSLLDRY